MPGGCAGPCPFQKGRAAGEVYGVSPGLLQLILKCSSFITYPHFCRPAIIFMREVDGDVPSMGKVYYRCFQLQQKLAAVD